MLPRHFAAYSAMYFAVYFASVLRRIPHLFYRRTSHLSCVVFRICFTVVLRVCLASYSASVLRCIPRPILRIRASAHFLSLQSSDFLITGARGAKACTVLPFSPPCMMSGLAVCDEAAFRDRTHLSDLRTPAYVDSPHCGSQIKEAAPVRLTGAAFIMIPIWS